MTAHTTAPTTAPTHLRVEHLDRPLGTGEPAPRLSWRLPVGSTAQSAYEVQVDGETTGRVDADASVLVPWPGPPLGSRRRVTWRVRVWTDSGATGWSAPSTFETGLLDAADWVAQWIEPDERDRPPAGSRPAYVLARDFDVPEPTDLAGARLYASAHGLYEAFLNGRRVGDVELTPGFTSYDAHLQVQTYDVSDLVRTGRNRWEVVLSDGWYRGRTGFTQVADQYGDTVAFLGQLHVGDAVVATGDGWTWATGPIVTADLMAGQTTDHRRAPTSWVPVRVVDHGHDRLTASPAPPTRRVQQVRPVSVTRPLPDRQVVDLGQNINGWVRLTDLGPAGTTLTLTHGEALDARGDVTQDHLAAFDFADPSRIIPVGMIDRVTSAGRDGDVFEPRHTTHGFRYVRVEGHPGRLTPDDVTGVVVHSDLRRTGWFRCSDERVNRFHDITDWSFRGNACEVPTDCPQRERAGWTGDYQVFVPSAAFLYDVAGFSLKWLRDVVADARPDGCITNFAPDPARRKALAARSRTWMGMQGSSGWGDAITIVPWELWRAYGDDGVLAETWPAMLAWIDFAAGRARARRHPSRVARSADPAPHEAFLWDTGFHWGEWLEPGPPEPMEQLLARDKSDVATAYLHRSAQLAARVGRLLGHDDEAERLDELAAATLDAWRTEFIAADGSLAPDTQANHVRALAFGLVPDDLRAQTADHLAALVRAAGTHLGTGFLATPSLLPVLADTGHLELAYELLAQDTPPSWLAMVARGATTVWEDWEGVDDDGVPRASLNHYSKGAVISFLHRYTAGIQLVDDGPAYRRFRVAPRPGGGLRWAEAVHDSPYGRIESSWRRAGGQFHLTVTVAPGTAAEVVLPDGTRADAGPGIHTYGCRDSPLPSTKI
jgi:alpha-L-rhamnosidase